MANRFSPQSTPIASVADAQAARPTRGMLERGTRGHFLRWKGNKLMAANFFGSPIRSMELMGPASVLDTVDALENKVRGLEQRIGQLEAENDFLRGLVVARDGGDKEELMVRWGKFGSGKGDRKGSEGKNGVGTEDSEA